MSTTRREKQTKKALMKAREAGFSTNVRNEKVPTYSALHDMNLRHYFENRHLQSHLRNTGLIDTTGRVIDMEKHKGKIAIIEQEFKNAEKAEYIREKEEHDMRHRVQLKRHLALDESRRQERLFKMKEDRSIRKEIVKASREFISPDLNAAMTSPLTKKNKGKNRKTNQ